MITDLHLHTTFSDGSYTPSQAVDMAVESGLDGIAITDHDSLEGIEAAVKRGKLYNDFYIIPGIEFGCVYLDEEVHLLGYFFDYYSENMLSLTKGLKDARVTRGEKIIKKLNNLGIKITIDDVIKHARKDYIGRPHIGRALIDKGYVNSMDEAFGKYLNRGKPAYVERYKLRIEEVVELIHSENGLVSLAHPGLLDQKEIINHCIKSGIDGIEVIHPKHSNKNVLDFIKVAERFNLIATGGSDWHGNFKDGDCLLGKYYVNLNNIPEMKRRIQNVNI
ncbi:MAG TPA: PHP domain-containing protein [Tissierellales bacterium]|nr:PHP domain-containing protein [Tissierellales bacterium]